MVSSSQPIVEFLKNRMEDGLLK